MNNVLIIEDDKEICVMIKDHLEKYSLLHQSDYNIGGVSDSVSDFCSYIFRY